MKQEKIMVQRTHTVRLKSSSIVFMQNLLNDKELNNKGGGGGADVLISPFGGLMYFLNSCF